MAPVQLIDQLRPPAGDGHQADLVQQADHLLIVMASLRRSGRLLARRPVELSNLTGSQVELVRLVHRRPGVSVAQAAEELRLAPNTVSTLVRQLTDQHLLIRRVDPLDRRVARLDLSAAMQRKVGAFRDRRVATLVTAMQGLPAHDQARLRDSLLVLDQLDALLLAQEAAHDQ
jgi:DNA-binding MarR family transcriptional regulator